MLTYTVSDGTVTISIDGIANNTAQESGSVTSGLADGSHTVTIIAVDEAGNVGSATVTFTIDTATTAKTTTTTTSTTKPAAGTFSGLLYILIAIRTLAVAIRRRKKRI
jgi:predicted S18 family serine protease